MGKIIKGIVGALIAVAGVLTGNPALIAAGISIGKSALVKKPKTARPSRENIDRLNASIVVNAPRKYVFGSTALATDIRDHEYTGNQEYLHRFIVVAAHKVHSIQNIYFDDKLAWTVAGGAQGEFAGYLTVAPILEGNAGNAINISARMGTTRRFTGCAYVHIRYKLTGNSKKAESPFANGTTTRITIEGEGALTYDPRKDSTVGGSGLHRANDQSTWEWDANASRNPAICLANQLLGWRINGLLSVGFGIPANRIDWASFIAAANICDETVAIAAGGTEPRYRFDGIFSEGDDPNGVFDHFKETMFADLDDVDGKLRLTCFVNDLAAVQATFSDNDIIGNVVWRPFLTLDQNINIVRGQYTDSRVESLYQPNDYPESSETSIDGIDRIETLDLPYVESATQSQRLAQLVRLRNKYSGTFSCVLKATGWKVQKNSVVSITKDGLFTNKLFRVQEIEHRLDGTVPVSFIEEEASIYTWTTGMEGTVGVPVAPVSYNYLLNPFLSDFIATGLGQAISTSTAVGLGAISQANAGTDVTVTIPAHSRMYTPPYPERAVNGGTVTGLVYATEYLIYYDDVGALGGAVTYMATTDPALAYATTANPGRHFVAFVTTMASGGGGGSISIGGFTGLGEIDLSNIPGWYY